MALAGTANVDSPWQAAGAGRGVRLSPIPSGPRDDLLTYLRSVGVDAFYPDGNGWGRVNSWPGTSPRGHEVEQ